MNMKIKEILLLFLKEKVVTASWGISNIRILPNNLMFSVEAMEYKGVVQISPINDTDCMVCLSGKAVFKCHIKNLVFKLDSLIERSDNYYANLLSWLHDK